MKFTKISLLISFGLATITAINAMVIDGDNVDFVLFVLLGNFALAGVDICDRLEADNA